MSRTDKDRPTWVVRYTENYPIEHDHRSGECRVSTFEDERLSRHGHIRAPYQHNKVCKKREVVEYFCTRANPEKRPNTFFSIHHTYVYCYSTVIVADTLTRLGCAGHIRVIMHDEIPCSCDNKIELPTCEPGWGDHRPWYWSGAPAWYCRAVFTQPERARERTELRDAVKLANAGELDEGFDFENRQHRHGAVWTWW